MSERWAVLLRAAQEPRGACVEDLREALPGADLGEILLELRSLGVPVSLRRENGSWRVCLPAHWRAFVRGVAAARRALERRDQP